MQIPEEESKEEIIQEKQMMIDKPMSNLGKEYTIMFALLSEIMKNLH